MKKGIVGKVIKTILSLILTLILAVLMFAANVILPGYDRMGNSILNGFNRTVDNKGAAAQGLDLEYNKADYTRETIGAAEDALARDIASEGLVLLKNEDSALPVSGDTVFSLFSANSDLTVGGGMLGGGSPLKDLFTASGIKINEKLWDFYSKGGGINHVAIYIGNGQVCHASNAKDGIKISTWNYRTPTTIRNVLGD